MTIWDKIYKHYIKSGQEYATLKKGLMPQFVAFIQSQEFKTKTVLDVGCGNGKYLVYLKGLGFVTDGIDSSPTAVKMTKDALADNSDILTNSMYDYDYTTSKYSLIISISALHHGLKSQVTKAIKKIHGALLPKGVSFITLPDNEGSSHWTMMADHKEIEPGTRIPLSGPEKGLPHSSYTKEEIQNMFSDFSGVDTYLLSDRGKWIISGIK